MKSFLMLAGALVLSTSAAFAQTVVSGTTTPGTAVPGTVSAGQPATPIGDSNAGSARGRGRHATAPNMTREDKKMMRKMGKVKYKATDEETKTQ
jgi:opacity protein-like surface antigen